MEVDIDAVGEQLRIFQDQYKEKSKEYDRLYEKFNQTSQVQQHPNHRDFILLNKSVFFWLKAIYFKHILLLLYYIRVLTVRPSMSK